MAVESWALPPEMNVGRLITGAWGAPMEIAFGFYTNLSRLYATASGTMTARLAQTLITYHGPSALIMQAAFTPYITATQFLAYQLGVAAGRAKAQAVAHSVAVAAMPTLAELAALQTQHATLVATNALVAGANTPAIVANEAAYAAEWTRAATVQTAYFADTVKNSTFEPFTIPPPIVSAPNGAAEAAIAATWASAATSPLQKLASAQQTAQANATNLKMLGNQVASTAVDETRRGSDRGQIATDKALREGATKAAMTGGQVGVSAVSMAAGQGMSWGTRLASMVTEKMQQHFDNAGVKNPGGIPGSHHSGGSGALDRMAAGGTAGGGMLALSAVGQQLHGAATGLRVPANWSTVLVGATPAVAVAAAPLAGSMIPPITPPPVRDEAAVAATTPPKPPQEAHDDDTPQQYMPLAMIGGD